jgi:predicted glycogen debranching enzyme
MVLDDSDFSWRWRGSAGTDGLGELLAREWLETNGLGSFASSTVCGANTRRYHALLIAATRPPLGRVALVNCLHETLVGPDGRTELATNLYHGRFVHPAGYTQLESFAPVPAPTWMFRTSGALLEKTLAMIAGRQLTVVRYELKSGGPVEVEVRVLLSGRDYHAVMRANDAVKLNCRTTPGMVNIPLYDDVPEVWLGHHAVAFEPERTWYYNFDYPRERERGLEDREDLISAGVLRFRLQPGRPVFLAIGTEPVPADEAANLFRHEIESRQRWPLSDNPDPLVRGLARATGQYIVERGDGLKTVIAGYPWFTDWGRDTFISLPGLALVTGRFDVARRIIEAFAPHVSEGMVPNLFPDAGGTAEYNTIDGTLWYVNAVYRYVAYARDLGLLRGGLIDVLDSIIDWHERGTRYNIHEDSDGLLAGGADGVQLTWMDAKVGDVVVTPRRGKPVEISALWYNALQTLAELSRQLGRSKQAERYARKAERTCAAFNASFWNSNTSCLFDVLDDDGADASIRPNQLFAISLPFPVLDETRRQAVVRVVEEKLLTPLGLRTLDPSHPHYTGRFEGGPWQRDHAYHQGTAWPWLSGPFVTAYIRSHCDRPAARTRMRKLLENLGLQLNEAGLGSICEVADGDPPHRPGGCYFQAWSVAEPLRALCEDVLGRGPGNS